MVALGFRPSQSCSIAHDLTTVLTDCEFYEVRTQEVSELLRDSELLMSAATILTQVFGF